MGSDVSYLKYLSTWLKPVAQSKSSQWKRCWRASVDGWAASTFHSRCDNKGPTVTIIRVSGTYIFGGYTSLSWSKYYIRILSIIKVFGGKVIIGNNGYYYYYYYYYYCYYYYYYYYYSEILIHSSGGNQQP